MDLSIILKVCLVFDTLVCKCWQSLTLAISSHRLPRRWYEKRHCPERDISWCRDTIVLLMEGYKDTNHPSQSDPLTFASKSTVRCLILAWNPAASVTKLPKWAPIPPPPPKFYFAEETFGTVRPPCWGGGEYIGGRGDPIIQIISPPVFAWIISLGATVSTRALRRSLLIFDCGWRRYHFPSEQKS